MKIDFLEIINFRNMRSAALDFANRNFVALIGDNGSGKTTILESITKAFVPVLRAVNGEAVKQCDLSNTDIKEGTSSVAVTLGIDLEGAKYTWTNKRRKASIFPYDEAIEIRGQNGNDLKKLKQKYIECVTAGYLQNIESIDIPFLLFVEHLLCADRSGSGGDLIHGSFCYL